ncbi:MAG: hypothetical protein R2755_33970 [Acidimicrobiales bacterium]
MQFETAFLRFLRIIEQLSVRALEDGPRHRRRPQAWRCLFFAGSGGGAGCASHAACDFRKLGGIEAYCVSDNVSELTARITDDGWDFASPASRASRFSGDDALFVFSVGGDAARGISANLVNAMALARGEQPNPHP